MSNTPAPPPPPPSFNSSADSAPTSSMNPVGVLRRLVAGFVGYLMFLALAFVAFLLAWVLVQPNTSSMDDSVGGFFSTVGDVFMVIAVTGVITAIAGLALSLGFWSRSTTLSKKLLGLRVVDVRTGAPASMAQMVLRELIGKLAVLVGITWLLGQVSERASSYGLVLYVLVGLAMILRSPTRQGPWDYLAKTTVVNAR